jgi:hypothetical protein
MTTEVRRPVRRGVAIGLVVSVLASVAVSVPGMRRLDMDETALAAARRTVEAIATARDAATVLASSTSDGAPSVGPDESAPWAPAPDGPWIVAAGTSAAGSGPVLRYTVEVEDTLAIDLAGVVAVVEGALYDSRSWSREVRFERVDDPALASVRVLVARPEEVDRLCLSAGLDTRSLYSCWNGTFAALNSVRWVNGAEAFAGDIEAYRRYLVNHEVGHALGRRHEWCTTSGALASVMMQQTKGVGPCVPNPWPYP